MFPFRKNLDWLADLAEQDKDVISRTPDLWRLEHYDTQLVFLPDDLQRGHQRHSVIEGHARFRAKAFTEGSFTVFKKKLGLESFPILFTERFKTAPHTRVFGELFSVKSPDGIKILDEHRDNRVQFLRHKVRIILPFRRETEKGGGVFKPEQKTFPVWTYLGNMEYWGDMLDGGYLFEPVKIYDVSPKKHRKENLKQPYYAFTKAEYK